VKSIRPLTAAALAVLFATLPALAADKKGKKKSKDDAAPVVAHIKLSGSLDEAPTPSDPLFGSLTENFKAKLDRIAKAKKDANVKALLLEIEDLSIGWGKMDELRNAIADFRASGKKAYAYMESATGKDYLVALACDVVGLPESGEVMLPGVRAEVMFFKDLLEKLHLQADFLQMGDYKGAAEPFTRSSMSPQFRQQFETVINDFFEKGYVETIIQSRPEKKWTTEQVKEIIDVGLHGAKKAAEIGLIDRIAYEKDFEEALKADLKLEKVEVARNYGKAKTDDVDLSNPFAIFKLLQPSKKEESKNAKVAVIYAVGEIVTGKGGGNPFSDDSGMVGSATTIEAIRQAEKDETVKAIVLRVDSPGGSALASDLIWNELVKCKKPVVASMGDVAASGGYYISMACPKIYAEPGTLTGSIGVVGGKVCTGGLTDWVGLKTEVISRGKNSGILSGERPWTDSERKVMLAMMQEVYDQFLDKTLAGRKKAGVTMTKDDLLKLAGGRIWTGRQAKEKGLVDELGTLKDAVAAAQKMAGVEDKDLEWLVLPKAKSILDRFFDNDTDAKSPVTGRLLREVPGLGEHMRTVEGLLRLRNDRVWLMAPYKLEVK